MFSPIATLIVGLIVGYIAWQQWQVAKAKLRLDLFDRRYKVFDATRKFLVVIVKNARFDDSQLLDFCAGTSDTEFLFGRDVVDYLTQIRTRALDARAHHEELQATPVGDERSRRVHAKQDQILWLGEQLGTMTKTFSPYLGFSNVK
jgi:hypothetical protein